MVHVDVVAAGHRTKGVGSDAHVAVNLRDGPVCGEGGADGDARGRACDSDSGVEMTVVASGELASALDEKRRRDGGLFQSLEDHGDGRFVI